MKNISLKVQYVFITPWCPVNKLEWYVITGMLLQVSGIANSTVSFSGVVSSLNNNEFSNLMFPPFVCLS